MEVNLDFKNLKQPVVKFAYAGEKLDIKMGNSGSVTIGKIQMNTDVANDTLQKDILLQWPVKGSLNMEKGVISMAMFNQKFEIPSIVMNFDPETF